MCIRDSLCNGLPVISKLREIPYKPFPDCQFTKMTERRIADIMNQTRTLQDIADIFLHLHGKQRIFLVRQNILSDVLSQRLGKGRYFQRMGQPRPDKVALIQRKYLRFILQPPERRAPYNPVIIFLKFTS